MCIDSQQLWVCQFPASDERQVQARGLRGHLVRIVGLHDGPRGQQADGSLGVRQRLGQAGQNVCQQEVSPGHLAHRRGHSEQGAREKQPRLLRSAPGFLAACSAQSDKPCCRRGLCHIRKCMLMGEMQPRIAFKRRKLQLKSCECRSADRQEQSWSPVALSLRQSLLQPPRRNRALHYIDADHAQGHNKAGTCHSQTWQKVLC